MLMSKVVKNPIAGPTRVKPWLCFNKTAQAISIKPAITRMSQAMRSSIHTNELMTLWARAQMAESCHSSTGGG
jgi:hypothetical protein